MENDIYNKLQDVSRQSYPTRDKLRKQSKDRVRKMVETRLRTTMIGAISKVEAFLGDKWGHGLKEEQCNPDQLDFYDVWEQCRDEILNVGNKQIRAALADLDSYDVECKDLKERRINFKVDNRRNYEQS